LGVWKLKIMINMRVMMC